MSKIEQMPEANHKSGVIREKHGIPVYRTNPSVPDTNEISRARRVQLGDKHRGFVVDNGTGEVSVQGMHT